LRAVNTKVRVQECLEGGHSLSVVRAQKILKQVSRDLILDGLNYARNIFVIQSRYCDSCIRHLVFSEVILIVEQLDKKTR
jgi:hypothetical protein